MLQHCMIIDSNDNNNKTKECGSHHCGYHAARLRRGCGCSAHKPHALTVDHFLLAKHGVVPLFPGAVLTMRCNVVWEMSVLFSYLGMAYL